MDNYSYYLGKSFEEYEGKWIAIKDQKVIVASEDLSQVFETLKKRGITLQGIAIASIPPKDAALICACEDQESKVLNFSEATCPLSVTQSL